jgi:acyl carrier protein
MVDRSSIRHTLIRFLQEDTSIDTASIYDSTTIADGLGLNSVDFVELIMRIEGYFRIRMTQAELEQIETVGDLLNLMTSKVRKPAKPAKAA